MEHQFPSHPFPASLSQQHPQHLYSTSPYNVFVNHPNYLTGKFPLIFSSGEIEFVRNDLVFTYVCICIFISLFPGNMQLNSQQHITYSTNVNLYMRSGVGSSSSIAQQRRTVSSVPCINGAISRGSLNHGGVASSSIHHQHMRTAATSISQSRLSAMSVSAPLSAANISNISLHRWPPQPLCMVVNAKYVGAIIGQGGSNIRELSREAKARCVVDVHKTLRDINGNTEKVISITGLPENCSKACMKLLEVVRRELNKDVVIAKTSELQLKLLVQNHAVGRLIGKKGANIKKIMEETGAVLFVSNETMPVQVMYGFLPRFESQPNVCSTNLSSNTERTITIKANDIGALSAAERKISEKVRQSYDTDNRVARPSNALSMFPYLGNDPRSCANMGITTGTLPFGNRFQASNILDFAPRSVRVWVPNNMVGALIGSKGNHIRTIMRLTGVNVSIESGKSTNNENKVMAENLERISPDKCAHEASNSCKADDIESEETKEVIAKVEGADENKDKAEADGETAGPSKPFEKELDSHAHERQVTIIGNEIQQNKTQCWLYQRIADQSSRYIEDVRLCTEIDVPSKVVGRIIGKGGQNVRELQRYTGALVKIPDDGGNESKEATKVRIIGNFHGSTVVQARLLRLINEFNAKEMNGQNVPGPDFTSYDQGACKWPSS